jgi:hypothetical protein
MKIIISNKSKLGLKQVVVTKNNPVSKVNFSKVSRIASLSLGQLNDVSVAGASDGDVLVFNQANNTYVVEVLPKIDGGIY